VWANAPCAAAIWPVTASEQAKFLCEHICTSSSWRKTSDCAGQQDFSRELFKEGVLGTGIAFPTVPEGKARVRTIMTATHTKEQLQQALEVLERVGKKMGIVR
jgi:7-keto-8-aminopelargonate synthetase-like enzyme